MTLDLSFAAYFGWTTVLTVMTGKAVNAQAAAGEDEPDDATLAEQVADLAAQVAALQHPPIVEASSRANPALSTGR